MRKLLPTLSLIIALAALPACGATGQPTASSGSAPVAVAPPASTTPRGTVEKRIGEEAGLTNMDGSTLLTFTVDEIAAAQCKSGAFGKKAQGRYISVDMTIHTKDDPQNVLPLTSLSTGWEHVTADGVATEASTLDASICGTEYKDLGPNRTYHQTVVLDVPKDSAGGVITLRVGAGQGWEWKLDT